MPLIKSLEDPKICTIKYLKNIIDTKQKKVRSAKQNWFTIITFPFCKISPVVF